MARNVFISFLGATSYQECTYFFENDPSAENAPSPFLHTFLAEKLCKSWAKEDRFLVFVTDAARANNWDKRILSFNRGTGEATWDNEGGLAQRMAALGMKPSVEAISIPEGKNTEEMWGIFTKVFQEIKEGDELHLDITNSFRFIPTLSAILVNYAKTVRNAKIKGVYYGNFEARTDDNRAPVANLGAFSELQDWAAAADHFIRFGNADELIGLMAEEPRLSSFSSRLADFLAAVQTSRGQVFFNDFDAQAFRKSLAESKDSSFGMLLNPVLDKVEDKIAPFQENKIMNGFAAVAWSIEHKLVPQAYTLLQEGVLSFILLVEQPKLDYLNPVARKTLSSVLNGVPRNKFAFDKDEKSKKLQTELLGDFYGSRLVERLQKHYRKLSDLRNDINHGGFRDKPADAGTLFYELRKTYASIMEIVQTRTSRMR